MKNKNTYGHTTLIMVAAVGTATLITAGLTVNTHHGVDSFKTPVAPGVSAEIAKKSPKNAFSPSTTAKILPMSYQIGENDPVWQGVLDELASDNVTLAQVTLSSGSNASISMPKPLQILESNAAATAKTRIKLPVVPRNERGLMPVGQGMDWDRELAVAQLEEELTSRKEFAWAIAKQEGWAPIGDFNEDSGFELMAMNDGAPYEYATDNIDAAVSAATDTAATQSALPLTGAGLTVGIWDQGAVSATHQELVGRVTIGDGSYAMNHPTHAGGTIAAAGVSPTAQGMAPDIQLVSQDWTADLAEMAALAMSAPGQPNTIQISSHSYGFVAGWATSYSPPRWYGNAGEPEAANFGLYDYYAMKWDELCHDAPYYLPFKSSGNNRMDNAPAAGSSYKYYDGGWQTKAYDPATDPAGDGDANGGFDSIPLIANAKNIMTVGAVEDAVTGDTRDVSKANMTGFSGWGPTDDGRIKPDIVANGSILYSSKSSSDAAYGVMSGTSMSTPSAAGSAALLVELYNRLFVGDAMPASMIKALILHTADDLGNAGPDYRYGWGLMNTRAAAEIIEQHFANPNAARMSTATLNDGDEHSIRMDWDGSSPIRVTASWTDPAAPYTYDFDDRTPRLVHDIDMVIIDPNRNVYQPFLLDPANPNAVAVTGDNNVDNVEQVLIAAPAVPGTYEIIIRTGGALAEGSQDYSLVITGLNPVGEAVADTTAPDMQDVVLTSNKRAFGRYVIDTTVDLGWTSASDDTGIDGYFFGVNNDNVESAEFTTGRNATVSGLVRDRENTLYVWAVDTAGNVSAPVTLSAYRLDPAGNWDGVSIPGGNQARSASEPSDPTVDADMIDGNPVLRWGYTSGASYEIQACPTIDDPGGWQSVPNPSLSLDGGDVIWVGANLDAATADGYFRVLVAGDDNTDPVGGDDPAEEDEPADDEPPVVEPAPAPAPAPTPAPAPVVLSGMDLFIQWLLTLDRNIWWVNFLLMILTAA